MKEFFQFNNLKRGKFYQLSEKIIFNQRIRNKDFSECSFSKIDFINCELDSTSFPIKCENLYFKNCVLREITFRKSDLEDFTIVNCKLISSNFIRSDLANFTIVNCHLENVFFGATELFDSNFQNSQLKDIWFSHCSLDLVKIKNSTLKNITVNNSTCYKEISENGKIIVTSIPIEDYASFQKEIICNDSNDDQVLKSTLILFVFVTLVVYSFLNPILFNIIW